MKTIYLTLLSAVLLTASCNGNSKKNVTTEPQDTIAVAIEDTVKTYNYFGTYEGTLSDAKGKDIKTVVTLNEDTTYDLLKTYADKEQPAETCGVYNILANNVVELVEPSSDRRTYYKITEDALVLTDSLGTAGQDGQTDRNILKRK